MTPPQVASRSILIVDDDEALRDALIRAFTRRGWAASGAPDGPTAFLSFANEPTDVVLLDLRLPGIDGLQVLARVKELNPDAAVIMLTGEGDVAAAVAAMSAGAETMLIKPVDIDHLFAMCERAHEKTLLRLHNRVLAERQVEYSELDTLGRSPPMRDLAQQIALLAPGSAPVLLNGETGSGKGWAAKLIHAASDRVAGPFISVNCAGLSATFLDSELFGHEKGAFTDAKSRKLGLFEVANGGTLMLDEIGDLAVDLQPKLLTAIETQRFRRVGGVREVQVDVRLIAATHVDLAAAVRAGRFREDLFYRLAVFPLRIPSLRERGPEDIEALADRLVADLSRQFGRGPTRIAPAAMDALRRYAWPGNVRELRNVLERAVVLSAGHEQLTGAVLPTDIVGSVFAGVVAQDDLTLALAERQHIARVLSLAEGNHRKAARLLGIARQTLYNKLRRLTGDQNE
jgi:two-component system, NtrC family, response regulator AtoC